MSSPTEQYTESLKKSQEAVLDAMQAWTKRVDEELAAVAAAEEAVQIFRRAGDIR